MESLKAHRMAEVNDDVKKENFMTEMVTVPSTTTVSQLNIITHIPLERRSLEQLVESLTVRSIKTSLV